jgi:Subtilase family
VTPPGKSLRRRAGICSLAAFVLACAWVPVALATASRSREGDLSPRLAELARPSVRSASHAAQARALSVPVDGPGSLLRDGNRVFVEVRFAHGAAAAADDLRAAGAKIVDVSSRYQTVTVAAKPGQLRRLSGVPRVAAATEVLAPIVSGAGGSGPVTAAATPCFGAATSEGDQQLRAALARKEFEVDGSGVEVGILSDSFDQDALAETHESGDIATGDLPGPGNPCGWTTPVNVLDDTEEEGEDEGRAMAQIVHDLAPGAALSFATAFTGIPAFAGNVEALAAAGANAIVDDVTYFEEPFFQEGPVGVAVSNVTGDDVNYFSSAGNDNLIDGAGRDIASWEAPQFRLANTCPSSLSAVLEYVTQCMDFNPGLVESDPTFGITVSKGAELMLDLQWAEPWNGVQTDLDAYLLDKNGNPIFAGEGEVVSSERANVAKTQRPFEFLSWENDTGSQQEVQVVINRYTGSGGGGSASPRLKLALLENGRGVTSTEYPESSEGPEGDVVGPTIFGHNGAEDAVSVGAVPAPPFFEDEPEEYSSRGPVTNYFGPVDGTTPAEPLVTPVVLPKPDVVATDGGANTFFGSCVSKTWRFFGTSAAAPHAAAVAALERQAVPGATAAELKEAQLATAGPVGAFVRPGPAIGAGIVNAAAAIAKLESKPFSEPIIQITPPAPQNCDLPAPPSPPLIPVTPNTETPNELPPPPEVRRRPRTFLLRHPSKVIRTRRLEARVAFQFGSDESGVTFLCRVDREPLRPCKARFVGRFDLGPHVMRVAARNASGRTDSTPAVYRFRVKRLS